MKDRGEQNRYASIDMDDEDSVIYDRENHQAWLQSTEIIDMAEPEESRFWKE